MTLQKLSISAGKPAQILEAQTDQLTKKLNVTDLKTASTEVSVAPQRCRAVTRLRN